MPYLTLEPRPCSLPDPIAKTQCRQPAFEIEKKLEVFKQNGYGDPRDSILVLTF